MESSTKILRRLLDERGVWHEDIVDATLWRGSDGTACTAAEVYHGDMKPSAEKLVIRLMLTPEQAIAATLGCGTCKEVYLLMATDIGNGREEVLGAYATESAATKAISENQFGYAFHYVRKLEVG